MKPHRNIENVKVIGHLEFLIMLLLRLHEGLEPISRDKRVWHGLFWRLKHEFRFPELKELKFYRKGEDLVSDELSHDFYLLIVGKILQEVAPSFVYKFNQRIALSMEIELRQRLKLSKTRLNRALVAYYFQLQQ